MSRSRPLRRRQITKTRTRTRTRSRAPVAADVGPAALDRRESWLRDRFKRGRFDAQLFQRAEELRVAIQSRDPVGDRQLLKCRSMVAEILDVQGRLIEARLAVDRGDAVRAALAAAPPPTTPALQSLARERVRYVADFARLHLYRDGHYERAKRILEFCRDVVETQLRGPDPTFRCHGTMGLVLYYLGCCERQLGRLDDADAAYGAAIDEHRARARRALAERDPGKREADLAFARHSMAIILGLGLGWTNSQRGLLSKALGGNIVPAQVVLLEGTDQTHQAYLALIHGAVKRSLAGTAEPEMVKEAIDAVTPAYRDFITEPYCHRSYAARAAYELALCYLALDQLAEADHWVQRLEDFQDPRWQANAHIIRSRIERRKFLLHHLPEHAERALAAAIESKRLIEGHEESLGHIDAFIACAEAFLELRRPAEARGELAEALRLARRQQHRNAKIEAVLHVHFARTYFLADDRDKAKEHFEEWEKLKVLVEHARVHEMADAIGSDLKRRDEPFRIQWTASESRYPVHDQALRLWLLQRASVIYRGKTKQEVANMLDIAVPTLRAWEVELKVSVDSVGRGRPSRRRPS